MHLDYIDRQILLEQHSGEIKSKIDDIINLNKEKDNNNNNDISAIDNTGVDLGKDIKGNEISLIETQNENNLKKHLTSQV